MPDVGFGAHRKATTSSLVARCPPVGRAAEDERDDSPGLPGGLTGPAPLQQLTDKLLAGVARERAGWPRPGGGGGTCRVLVQRDPALVVEDGQPVLADAGFLPTVLQGLVEQCRANGVSDALVQ